ncbi:MAG TPA: hypothetical protein VMT28_09350 [Terriglobales bacterium]|jgi:large-conductance mechanosensitive channel|nr:hypothetical protein [Terriglobales bacterium]
MNEPGSFAFDRANVRRLTGRMLMAVVLGLAIWNLIVAVMDYVVVPWLGDLVGPGSTLPLSFTQRPYDYPDLFVSVIEFCIAAIVAISINWYFQRPGKQVKVRVVKKTSVAPQSVDVAVATQVQPSPPVSPPPVPAPKPIVQAAPPGPPPAAAKPATPPVQPAPKPSRPQPVKEVQYNIVGEPLPPDED